MGGLVQQHLHLRALCSFPGWGSTLGSLSSRGTLSQQQQPQVWIHCGQAPCLDDLSFPIFKIGIMRPTPRDHIQKWGRVPRARQEWDI